MSALSLFATSPSASQPSAAYVGDDDSAAAEHHSQQPHRQSLIAYPTRHQPPPTLACSHKVSFSRLTTSRLVSSPGVTKPSSSQDHSLSSKYVMGEHEASTVHDTRVKREDDSHAQPQLVDERSFCDHATHTHDTCEAYAEEADMSWADELASEGGDADAECARDAAPAAWRSLQSAPVALTFSLPPALPPASGSSPTRQISSNSSRSSDVCCDDPAYMAAEADDVLLGDVTELGRRVGQARGISADVVTGPSSTHSSRQTGRTIDMKYRDERSCRSEMGGSRGSSSLSSDSGTSSSLGCRDVLPQQGPCRKDENAYSDTSRSEKDDEDEEERVAERVLHMLQQKDATIASLTRALSRQRHTTRRVRAQLQRMRSTLLCITSHRQANPPPHRAMPLDEQHECAHKQLLEPHQQQPCVCPVGDDDLCTANSPVTTTTSAVHTPLRYGSLSKQPTFIDQVHVDEDCVVRRTPDRHSDDRSSCSSTHICRGCVTSADDATNAAAYASHTPRHSRTCNEEKSSRPAHHFSAVAHARDEAHTRTISQSAASPDSHLHRNDDSPLCHISFPITEKESAREHYQHHLFSSQHDWLHTSLPLPSLSSASLLSDTHHRHEQLRRTRREALQARQAACTALLDHQHTVAALHRERRMRAAEAAAGQRRLAALRRRRAAAEAALAVLRKGVCELTRCALRAIPARGQCSSPATRALHAADECTNADMPALVGSCERHMTRRHTPRANKAESTHNEATNEEVSQESDSEEVSQELSHAEQGRRAHAVRHDTSDAMTRTCAAYGRCAHAQTTHTSPVRPRVRRAILPAFPAAAAAASVRQARTDTQRAVAAVAALTQHLHALRTRQRGVAHTLAHMGDERRRVQAELHALRTAHATEMSFHAHRYRAMQQSAAAQKDELVSKMARCCRVVGVELADCAAAVAKRAAETWEKELRRVRAEGGLITDAHDTFNQQQQQKQKQSDSYSCHRAHKHRRHRHTCSASDTKKRVHGHGRAEDDSTREQAILRECDAIAKTVLGLAGGWDALAALPSSPSRCEQGSEKAESETVCSRAAALCDEASVTQLAQRLGRYVCACAVREGMVSEEACEKMWETGVTVSLEDVHTAAVSVEERVAVTRRGVQESWMALMCPRG